MIARVFTAVANGFNTAAAVAAYTGLTAESCSRHLGKLAAGKQIARVGHVAARGRRGGRPQTVYALWSGTVVVRRSSVRTGAADPCETDGPVRRGELLSFEDEKQANPRGGTSCIPQNR